MMRRLSYLLLPMLLLWSCVRDNIDAEWDGPVIELTLVAPESVATRAGADGEKDGINKYNENLISWVDFFFYPEGKTDQDATWHTRITSGKQRSDVMRIKLTSDLINKKIFPPMDVNPPYCTVFALVNYPGTLVDYTLDSNGDPVPILTNTSLPELQADTVRTDFVSPANHRQPRFMMSGQEDLLLKGRAQVLAADGTIYLERYACKLTVGVDVKDLVEVVIGKTEGGDDKVEKWHPMLSGMEIYLVNGVNNVCLSGEQPDSASTSYFSYRDNSMRFAYTDMQDQTHFYFEKDGNFYNTYPTYMYPQHWDYGSTTSPNKEPYLKLVVPWVREPDPANGISGTQKQYYYKVMIPDDRRPEHVRSFVRNNWYHIDIRVSILGSDNDDAVVPILNGACYIVYWQDKDVVIKNAEIGRSRYLSVEQESYSFSNISDPIELVYTTSHSVMIDTIIATRPYYGEQTTGDALGGTIRKAGTGSIYPKGSYYLEYNKEQRMARNKSGKDWIEDIGTAIVFQHDLNNDYTDEYFDYSPYTITYTLRHADRPLDDAYEKTVTITQYPAVYIEAMENSDPTVVKKPGSNPKRFSYNSTYWGYVYVDGQHQWSCTEYEEKKDSLMALGGYTWNLDNSDSGGGNVRTHPEMMDIQWHVINFTGGSRDIYRMNITVLPGNADFVIGDARQSEIDNLNPKLNDGTPISFATAPSVKEYKDSDGNVVSITSEGEQRTLQYYHPTDSTARTRNLMSPSYRIASKHGGTEYYNGIPFDEAQYRCATYQEDGFPAGRWRLPTRGEIRFIAMLSANNAFRFLFSNGSYYWSANGAIYVQNNDVTDATKKYALARCVYDTWYWGDTRLSGTDKETFTWGDRP